MRLIANMNAQGPFSVVLATDPVGDCNFKEAATRPQFGTIEAAMSAKESEAVQ